MTQWTKPNGNVMETNDNKATIEYLESLGWTRNAAVDAGVEPLPENADPMPATVEELPETVQAPMKAKPRGRPRKAS